MKSLIKKIILFSAALFCITELSSCKKKKGCTDPNALNRDFDADKDDGSCIYYTAIFYMSVNNPARPVSVAVDGNAIGTITAQYPGGPGNCIAPGCAIYKFKTGQRVSWVATEPGGLIWTGTVEPSSVFDCIKIRVY